MLPRAVKLGDSFLRNPNKSRLIISQIVNHEKKKNNDDIPLNPGCLIGILILLFYYI